MQAHAERLDSLGYDATSTASSTALTTRTPTANGPFLSSAAGNRILRHPPGIHLGFQLLRGNSSNSLKSDLSGISSKLGGNAYQNRPMAVVAPSSTEPGGWSFPLKNCRTRPHATVLVLANRARPIAWRSRPTAPTMCDGSPGTPVQTGCTSCPSTSSLSSSSASMPRAGKFRASRRLIDAFSVMLAGIADLRA